MTPLAEPRLRAVGNLQQLGGTRLVTLEDGPERGVRVVEFRTSSGLEFGVLVDRAMDVGWCRYQGRSIAWHSPVGFVGPWYREPSGLGFLRSFPGGLFATSGLDHILFPEDDPEDTYGYPGRQSSEYGLHGRVSSTPATLRHHGERWDGDDWRLEAVGEVRQAGALAENLVMTRTVSTTMSGSSLVWQDVVRNQGHHTTPHMMLYHINLGAPLLDAACELVAPIREVTFRTPTASGDPGEHLEFHGPRRGFVEQAFAHDIACGPGGRATVALLNHADPDNPWGVVLRYDRERFPYFFQWRYLAEGTYVLGLEPSTNGLTGRAAARASGELTLLEPGEERTYRTELELVEGRTACDRAREEAREALRGVASATD